MHCRGAADEEVGVQALEVVEVSPSLVEVGEVVVEVVLVVVVLETVGGGVKAHALAGWHSAKGGGNGRLASWQDAGRAESRRTVDWAQGVRSCPPTWWNCTEIGQNMLWRNDKMTLGSAMVE